METKKIETFDELRENISLLETESDRTIYRISELKIDSIEEAIYHSSVLFDVVSELEHCNNEKQDRTGESFSFISEESIRELRRKISFWNKEIEKELKRYEKIIVERVVKIPGWKVLYPDWNKQI